MNDLSNIHRRLKELREHLNISQEEMAESVGLQRNTISLMENGKRNPSDRTIRDMCKQFKVNYFWLTEGDGEMIIDTPEEIFDEIRTEYDLTDDDVFILKEYTSMDKKQRDRLKIYLMAMIEAEKKEEG